VFESTNCVIARAGETDPARRKLIERLLGQFREGAMALARS
jgi:hypothetical protein